jgi:hypothetical protein
MSSRRGQKFYEQVRVGAAAEVRVNVPEEYRAEVLRETHEGAIGGHFGRTAMLRLIASRYIPWEGLVSDINGYECKHCDIYTPTKGRYASQAGVLQAYRVSKPWDLVGFDIQESLGVLADCYVP